MSMAKGVNLYGSVTSMAQTPQIQRLPMGVYFADAVSTRLAREVAANLDRGILQTWVCLKSGSTALSGCGRFSCPTYPCRGLSKFKR